MTKRLYRSRSNKIIAGVCGGLGEYFELDPIVFRLGFVVLALADGAGILGYIIAMIVIPQEPLGQQKPTGQSTVNSKASEKKVETKKSLTWSDSSVIGGVILIAIGAMFLLNNILNINVWGKFWPLILVIIGLVILSRSLQSKE